MSRAADLVLDGGVVAVVKTAVGASAASELRREGQRLQAAAHPGVVEVVQSSGDEQAWELRLLHGGRPVNLLHPAPPTRIAEVVGSAALVLGDLHERGIVHGRLRSDHVLVGAGGEVKLCGFGPGVDGADAADDVAALGSLIVELLGDREDLEPLPDARWHRRPPWAGVTRRSLLSLADAACAEPPSRRPAARRLAASIFEAVPEARGHRVLRQPHRRRLPAVAAVPAVLATLGLGLLGLAVARSGSAPTGAGAEKPERGAPVPCAVLAPAPIEGPCLGPVHVEGNVVTVGTDRFQVGGPGDEVVVGDWDCDGAVTPALLRRSTGEVFVFPGWSMRGDLRVTPEVRVPGATRLVMRERCGAPVVERADGSTHTVELGRGST